MTTLLFSKHVGLYIRRLEVLDINFCKRVSNERYEEKMRQSIAGYLSKNITKYSRNLDLSTANNAFPIRIVFICKSTCLTFPRNSRLLRQINNIIRRTQQFPFCLAYLAREI